MNQYDRPLVSGPRPNPASQAVAGTCAKRYRWSCRPGGFHARSVINRVHVVPEIQPGPACPKRERGGVTVLSMQSHGPGVR
jgi:hypothetical protein